jgi:DNA-binding MltR family transcriptional regulator
MPEDPTSADLIETLHILARRADTAYVIVAGTALEDVLEMALMAEMRDLSNTFYTQIFKGYGPLSRFAAKIDIAYALKIIDDDLIGDFNAIRAIRNAFAHAREAIYFGSSELKPHMQKLRGWTEMCDQRALFDERFKGCIDAVSSHVDTAIFVQALRKPQS